MGGMLYVLAYPRFAPDLLDRIQSFRQRHEPARAALVRPHVTLVFGLRDVDQSSFCAMSRRAVAGVGRFRVTFQGANLRFDPHAQDYKLMLTCIRGDATLSALHRRLYDGPHRSQFDARQPYQPHMTVGTNTQKAALASAGAAWSEPLSGQISALEVVRLADNRLTTCCTIALKAEP